jgi:adenylate kinase family enzyme
VVLGPGSAGKSALAALLGEIIGLPVVELDKRFWRPGLAPAPPAQWAAMRPSQPPADLAGDRR